MTREHAVGLLAQWEGDRAHPSLWERSLARALRASLEREAAARDAALDDAAAECDGVERERIEAAKNATGVRGSLGDAHAVGARVSAQRIRSLKSGAAR
ncbi:MAG TPA: hypothetical protein VM513_15240 [Kofleriaceae bacterium]|nr:hypothetical protein [Kofleriaceae bacterium]